MSFGLGNLGGPSALGGGGSTTAGNAQVKTGPDLQEITTEKLGFHALAGDAKVQLFSQPWPSESLPPSTASLLSVSSPKGLLAAASPDSIIIATTTAVREAFGNDSGSSDKKALSPQLTIPIGTRISQVAFTSNGSYLIISAETGGGLAVYETQSLLAGSTQSTFELSTDQVSLRALVPNPASESASLVALVTTKGDLMMADMNNRTFAHSQSGVVLKSGVSCISWSNKGKQLIAGLGNGTAAQMTPDGVMKAEVPRPADLENDSHISSAYWLENDLFLMAYTPSSVQDGPPPVTEYRLITRQPKTQNYAIQKLPEVCSPFGFQARQPSYQFMQRLRSFPPNLTDIIIVASTSSDDICLYTRASQSISNDPSSGDTTDTFTATGMADDSRRAAVPMADDMMDSTSAVGMSLDLSSTSSVPRPIPGDETEQSPGPLPAVYVLNHMGILSGWWVVYSESIHQGTSYPGLIAVGGEQALQPKPQTSAPSLFGGKAVPSSTTAFGSSSPLGNAQAPAFGTAPIPTSIFGGSSFSTPSALGNRSSPWGTNQASTSNSAFGQPSFGQPAFGSTSTPGTTKQAPAFGSASSMGSKPSLWGSTPQTTAQPSSSTGTVFGQASGLGSQRPSAFGAPSSSGIGSATGFSTASGGFASFANAGGFAATAASAPKGEAGGSIFKQSESNTFEAPKQAVPIFGSTSNTTVFGSKQQAVSSTGQNVGSDSQLFQLNSAWTNSNKEKAKPVEKGQGGTSIFGGGFSSEFSNALDMAKSEQTPASKEADMMSDQDEQPQDQPASNAAVASNPNQANTPSSTGIFGSKPSGGIFNTSKASGNSLMATPDKDSKTGPRTAAAMPKLTPESNKSTPQIISKESTAQTPSSQPQDSAASSATALPTIVKSDSTVSRIDQLQEPPLPPDTTSKATYTPGTSSNSSLSMSKTSLEEPPLPPNPFNITGKVNQSGKAEGAPLPPDITKGTSVTKEVESAPLPPDFVPKSASVKDATSQKDKPNPPAEQPVPGSALPETSISDDSDLDDEGSGVDVAQEIHAGGDPSPDLSPVSSFGTKAGKLSTGSSFQHAAPSRENSSRSLFGEVSAPIANLPPPQQAPVSPRSPSPVRLGARSALRAEASRSVSAPGVPLRADTSRKVTLGRPTQTQRVYPPVATAHPLEEERRRMAQQRARLQAEAEQELSDGEDEQTREYLNSDVEKTLVLPPFVAHQDYVGHVSKPGIPGQVERVYRDINSMVDTLGLNARALAGFIKGHDQFYEQGYGREDLENDGTCWVLADLDNLVEIEEELENDLDSEGSHDPSQMIKACMEISKELLRLKTRQNDIKHSVDANSDPELLDALRAAPLSTEQSSLRYDLRAKYTELQHQLAQCEEAISMLKTKFARLPSTKAKLNGASNVPTVEAVEKTILKMTSMFEKRSGDIDVLESHLRQLNLAGNKMAGRGSSPFMTSPPKRKETEASPASSMNGRSFYTPGSRRSGLAASISGTPSRFSRSPGKMVDIDSEVAQQYAVKAARRRQVRLLLKDALVSGDVRIRTLDDL